MGKFSSKLLALLFAFKVSDVKSVFVFKNWPKKSVPFFLKSRSLSFPEALANLFLAEKQLFEMLEHLNTVELLEQNFIQENIFNKELPENGITYKTAKAFEAWYIYANSFLNCSDLSKLEGFVPLKNFLWSPKISLDQLVEGGMLPLAVWKNIQTYSDDYPVAIHGFETGPEAVSVAARIFLGRVQNHLDIWKRFLKLLEPLKENILKLSLSNDTSKEFENLNNLWTYWQRQASN